MTDLATHFGLKKKRESHHEVGRQPGAIYGLRGLKFTGPLVTDLATHFGVEKKEAENKVTDGAE